MRIKINAQQAKRDIVRIQTKLQRLAVDIKNDSQSKIMECGNLGFNYALNLAPEYTGALKAAMRLEIGDNEAFIISSQPVGDMIPTHILFDKGTYPNPRLATSLGFMQKTYVFLKEEFSNRMNMAISHSIQKVGGKA